ncbi:IS30 family transposase [Actinomycetospora sp. OC33-EN07]|uniref:IS30 family transposase n=1 Tax=Actinomycetospora flava TaxID=3129232 RepID=A0ABU8MGQ6_9PSEU
MGVVGRPRSRVRERAFWRARLEGLEHEAACALVGVSQHRGWRWVREVGGMVPDLREPKGRYLSLAEQEEISRGLAADLSYAEIGRRIGRDRSTVKREVDRNHVTRERRGAHGGARTPAGPPRPYRRVDARQARRDAYRAGPARHKADQRARRPKPTKFSGHPELVTEVQQGLELHWSPEQIAAELRVRFPDRPEMWVSHETIYQELYVQGRGSLRRELHRCLRTGRALRRPRAFTRRSGRLHIPPEIMISERPAEARDRAVPGHWEGDLILGAANGSAIGTLVERSTRFVLLLHLPERHDAAAVRDAMVPAIRALPAGLRRSLAWDQGSEMARHHEIRIAADLPIYFCDPHSPWQRGSNENTNGLLRQYFPKGSDLSVHTADDLAAVAAELNGRPRKTLQWRSPARALDQLLSGPPITGVATTP